MNHLADPGEWYVAFEDSGQRYWWDLFTRPGFRHVMAFGYSAQARRWLVYDVTRTGTCIRAYRRMTFDIWVADLAPRAVILKVKAGPVGEPRRLGGLFVCTAAVKHLIGSGSRALRPQTFFRDLRASGATYAFGTGP